MKIVGIPTLSDNYTWVIHNANDATQTWVVDPGEAKAVIQYLQTHQCQLAGVLITHHHYDHVDGVQGLLDLFGEVPVYGNEDGPFKGITHPLKQGDTVTLSGEVFDVLSTPGHCPEHLSYSHPEALFCGDVLFTGGCGKIWDYPPELMAQSLLTLRNLPDQCEVYCGHEYTYANLKFATIAEPDNLSTQTRFNSVTQRTLMQQPCVPASLGIERQTNPFLRFDLPPLKNVLVERGADANSPASLFATLRAWKDVCDASGILELNNHD